ncbi:regulator of nonsense transcripts 3A [Topomyia yanbarensis]|uniref:regulator of nonsense transcripts 3A n=1 Tax=Topomyia yanbarensis TaxID=2498891 RepID=UPI00273B54B8|nr:regulator of nonsense transcripts 3A [Topomyia yanbarensis]XP_058830903.1 regulator of nonsense transcripts 3A [Topomyia yanbarensis]
MVESQQKFPETSDATVPAGGQLSTAPETTKSRQKKDKKETGGSKRNKKSKKDVPKPLTKVVIRRLPPSMDEETFRKQIDPIPDHEDFYFVSGDWSLGKNASSRAYISFSRAEDIFLFKDKFDGYIFVDSKGVEFPAVVEYAPFQELPRNRSRKKDAKCGTIETDTHFIAFQEALELEEKESAGKSKSKLEYSYQIKDEKKVTSTPLLEYIAQKRQEKREEKRRKMEEKKKQRKEERQKKSQTGKPISESIREEKGKEDDIVVRTVPSRLDPNQTKRDAVKKMNEKADVTKDSKDRDKKQRSRKEKDKERMKQEKDEAVGGQEKTLSRKQERDRQRKEKDKTKKQEEKDKKPSGDAPHWDKEVVPKAVEVEVPTKPSTSEVPRKEVKKYSERRKETRARAETRLAELEERNDVQTSITSEHFKSIPVIPKIDIKKSVLTPHVAPFIPKEKSTIILGESSVSLPPAFPQKSVVQTPAVSQLAEEPMVKKESTPAPDTPAADSSSSERKPDIDEKLKEAREARKIRNKNRPSIAIYQPRKRLIPGAAGGSKDGDDDKMKDKSDSDRSSDKSIKPRLNDEKDKRHKLTKKSSDKERPKDRRCRRKNSSDLEGDRDKKGPSRKNSREEPPPPAEPVPSASVDEKPVAQNVTETVEALEGINLNS